MDLNTLLKKEEKYYEENTFRQEMDPESPLYGFFLEEGGTAGNESILTVALPLYVNPDSKYYKDPDMLKRMHADMDMELKIQQPNGLVSLLDCNIYSPPDTGFRINNLFLSLDLMDKVQMPELEELREKVSRFLKNTIPGMCEGGFHTPNHRWVITAALAHLYARFHDERLKKRAYEYMAEGVDMNEAGEWSERSNSVYNSVSNIYAYHIAEVFGEERFLEAARKNLTMMEYMLHSNNCIVTEFSSRQDRGWIRRMNERFAAAYLLMAAKDGDPRFADMARRALEDATSCGYILHYIYLYREQFSKIPAPEAIPDHYTLLLNGDHEAALNQKKSGWGDPVLRYRRGKLSVTLMAGQQEFLYFQYGEARAFNIKLPVAWFGMAGASFPKIEELGENRYRLYTPLHGHYLEVQPAEAVAQYHGDWFEMSRHVPRKFINEVETEIEVIVTMKEDGLDLDITADKMAMIFMQLICQFDLKGRLSGSHLVEMESGAIRPTEGRVVYECGGDCISVTGEANGHHLAMMRNDVLTNKAQNVAFNAISPRSWHIEVRGFEKN